MTHWLTHTHIHYTHKHTWVECFLERGKPEGTKERYSYEKINLFLSLPSMYKSLKGMDYLFAWNKCANNAYSKGLFTWTLQETFTGSPSSGRKPTTYQKKLSGFFFFNKTYLTVKIGAFLSLLPIILPQAYTSSISPSQKCYKKQKMQNIFRAKQLNLLRVVFMPDIYTQGETSASQL